MNKEHDITWGAVIWSLLMGISLGIGWFLANKYNLLWLECFSIGLLFFGMDVLAKRLNNH